MSDNPTREEVRHIIDDKLATTEARTDVKFAEVNGRLDRLIDAVNSAHRYQRGAFLTTIATVIAVGVGIAGLVLTQQSNLVTSFQTGITAFSTSLQISQNAAKQNPDTTQKK